MRQPALARHSPGLTATGAISRAPSGVKALESGLHQPSDGPNPDLSARCRLE